MKTQKVNQSESERLEKETLINSIAEVLKKHCATRHDVECFIISLIGSSEFIAEMQAHEHNIIYRIQGVLNILRSHGTKEDIDLFEEISNSFLSGMILSGHLKEGNHLIYQMSKDLNSGI